MVESRNRNVLEALIALQIDGYLYGEWGNVPEGIALQADKKGFDSLSDDQYAVAENFIDYFIAGKVCRCGNHPIEADYLVFWLDEKMCPRHAHYYDK